MFVNHVHIPCNTCAFGNYTIGYKNDTTKICIKCPDGFSNISFGFFIGILIGILFAFLLFGTLIFRLNSNLRKNPKWRKFLRFWDKIIGRIDFQLITICITYIQLLSQLGDMNVNWSYLVKSFILGISTPVKVLTQPLDFGGIMSCTSSSILQTFSSPSIRYLLCIVIVCISCSFISQFDLLFLFYVIKGTIYR